MGKPKFSVSDLDQILSDAVDVNEITNIHNDLVQEEKDQLISDNDVSPQIANMVNQKNGLTVDYSRVYKQLQKLIQNGNVALEIIAAIDPDVSGGQIGSATANLMNAIRGCVAEFTKIHLQHIKYQQTLDMMKIKHQYKMEQIAKRNQAFKNRDDAIDITSANSTTVKGENGNVMVPWNTQNIIDYMNYLNKQKKGG